MYFLPLMASEIAPADEWAVEPVVEGGVERRARHGMGDDTSAGEASDSHFHTEIERIISVRTEGWDGGEAEALVEADGGLLVDAGFEAEEGVSVRARMVGKVGEHEMAEVTAAHLGDDEHALDLGVGLFGRAVLRVIARYEEDAATADGGMRER